MAEEEDISKYHMLLFERIAETTAERMFDKMKEVFVDQKHCIKKRGTIRTYVLIVAFVAVFSLGWKGVELLSVLF